MHGATLHHHIENVKKYPDTLQDGEPVVITEKLHGTSTTAVPVVHVQKGTVIR